MRKPDFFLVGAPRCGTSAMNAYLKEHPEIFMAEKESHFFATDLEAPHFIRDREAYLSLFTRANSEERVGESSVLYLYSQNAAFEIKKFCPEASIIIMLRNPVDMIYSLYHHHIYHGTEDILDFGTALEAEAERKRGDRIPDNARLVETLFYRDMARYARQVKRYLDTFGREHVLVIIYEEFKEKTADTYRNTLRFLGVNQSFQPDFRVVNPNKDVRFRTLDKLLKSRFTKSLLNRLPWSLHSPLERALRRFNTRVASRPPMESTLRRRLQEEFTPEVEELSELLKRDLMYWVKP